jgi:phage FluMu protein Com
MTESSTLDFERAEPAAPAAEGLRCAGCGEAISTAYWQVNAAVACERCKGVLARERATRHPGRFLLAGLYGLLAAAAGAGLYYAVAALTGYELGLIGIVVGIGVGMAVRKGGQGRGGWAYQGLAMLLTYLAIVSTYVPAIVTAFRDEGKARAATAAAAPRDAAAQPASPAAGDPAAPAPATPTSTAAAPAAGEAPADAVAGAQAPSFGGFLLAMLFVLAFAMALPFLAGLENLMGLAIIAFALYEAWKLNRAQPLVVTGPFDASAASGGGATAVG